MKFTALNVDINGPSLDLLGSRKTLQVRCILQIIYAHHEAHSMAFILTIFLSTKPMT